MTPRQRELIAKASERRQQVCEQINATDRRIGGKLSNSRNHGHAGVAEALVGEALRLPFQGTLPDRVDPGVDYILPDGRTVDAKWARLPYLMRLQKLDNTKPWCDIYVLVTGQTIYDMTIAGWATGTELRNAPTKEFGHGPTHAIHTTRLHHIKHIATTVNR